MPPTHSHRRLMIVGPTAPTKGGIAQHTDALIRHLAHDGHDVSVRSWAAQYPKRLYPGLQQTAESAEAPSLTHSTHRRSLRWFDPISWVRAGWSARSAEVLVIALVVPVQIVAFATIIAVSRLTRTPPSVAVIAHNVLPHEARGPDRFLVRCLCRLADRMVVHTEEQAALAVELGARRTEHLPIPPHLATAGRRRRTGEPSNERIAFLGIVREYKGVDVLLLALAELPTVELRIHGECWINVDTLEQQIDGSGLRDRVVIDNRFVPDDEVSALFDDVDALVLPYRSATASQLALIAHGLGVPVIATSVGSFPDQVTHDVDGLLCAPNDPDSLAEALRRLYEPGVLNQLRSGAFEAPDTDHLWAPYLRSVVAP